MFFNTTQIIAIKQGFPEGMKQRQTNIIIADNKIAKVVVRFRNLQPNLPVYSQHVYITNPIILIHVLIYRTHTLKTKKKKKICKSLSLKFILLQLSPTRS